MTKVYIVLSSDLDGGPWIEAVCSSAEKAWAKIEELKLEIPDCRYEVGEYKVD